MYQQDYSPLGSLALSALVAAIPLGGLFVLLGVVKMKAWMASLIGLVSALIVAIFAYDMPAGTGLASASQGAAFGLFPAMWIVANAIWIYQLTVVSGHFDVLRRSFGRVSPDHRVQAVIIAFCFGALLEALAGFGAPVAVTAVMLIALGFRPLKAAAVGLLANTAPVAFGAMALPIITLATVTGLPERELASIVGRQAPILALFVPLVLVYVVDKGRGVREAWPVAAVAGVFFAIGQFLMSNYGPVALADIVASLMSAGAVVVLLRFWQPPAHRGPGEAMLGDDEDDVPILATVGHATAGSAGHGPGERTTASSGAGGASAVDDAHVVDSRRDVWLAYFPYILIVAVFSVANIPAVKTALGKTTKLIHWPGVHVQNPSGKELTSSIYKFDWLANIGTLLFLIGIVTFLVLKISPAEAVRTYGRMLNQLKTAIVTVMAVLALAYVMNSSGQTVTLGLFLAQVGSIFALVSPLVGWIGVAVTGSDTSSNALFGLLQVQAAHGAGLDPTLTAAANTSGGVLGKMISPQNLAVGAAAVAMAGREGELFRKVIGWAIGLLVALCLLVYLQSTPVLSWMLP
ncbi:MAG: L-lactate permease [Tetrasphaera sp.]